MKKLAIALGIVLVCSSPSWGSGLGVGITTWDTENMDADEGFGFKFAVDMGEQFEGQLRVSFFDDLSRVANNALVRFEATPVDLGFAYKFGGAGEIKPYVGGGITFVFSDVNFDGGTPQATGQAEVDDEFGFYGVVGGNYALNDVLGVYGEAMYRVVKSEVTGNGIHFQDFEADLAGPSATLGIQLHW